MTVAEKPKPKLVFKVNRARDEAGIDLHFMRSSEGEVLVRLTVEEALDLARAITEVAS